MLKEYKHDTDMDATVESEKAFDPQAFLEGLTPEQVQELVDACVAKLAGGEEGSSEEATEPLPPEYV